MRPELLGTRGFVLYRDLGTLLQRGEGRRPGGKRGLRVLAVRDPGAIILPQRGAQGSLAPLPAVLVAPARLALAPARPGGKPRPAGDRRRPVLRRVVFFPGLR